MATWKPELHTIEAVLSYYEEYDFPAYRIYAGVSPKPEYCRFTYDGADKSIGREKLQEALLSVLQNSENTNTYTIQILKPKGKVFEPYNQITFQLNKVNSMLPGQVMAGYMQPQNNVNNEILSRLRGLEEKLSALENEEDEDYEEEEETNNNFLSGFLNTPEMKNLLMGLLSNVLTNNNKPKAMAGIKENIEINVSEDEKIAAAIEILKDKTENLGDKLLKLAEMSVSNPQQYNWLVKML